MPIKITMPALSPTMEEGTLAKWLKSEGDPVEPGDLIAEIETDKATMEVEAVDEGVLAKILVPEGTEAVKVNSLIAILAEEGEEPSEIDETAFEADQAPGHADKTTEPGAEKPDMSGAQTLAAGTAEPVSDQSKNSSGERIKASPLARRLAHLHGVDLSGLTGSGPHGRIVKKDVEAAAAEPKASLAAKTLALDTPTAVSAPRLDGDLILEQKLDPRVYDPDSYRLEPLDGMRRTVARRLTTSFMQIPHFPLNIDLQLDKLLSARKNINTRAPQGVKVSVNDLLIKASAMALIQVPECNASFSDAGIAYHKGAHISVAVAVEGGLITPVIRDAETKGLAALSAEMKDLASRARDRKLKPQEYMGGTFSLSNLGMFGIKSFASIINPPEGMILSIGAGEKRPVIGADEAISIATLMSVTLTCDHRVIGGAEGAKWLDAFKHYVEYPETMLL